MPPCHFASIRSLFLFFVSLGNRCVCACTSMKLSNHTVSFVSDSIWNYLHYHLSQPCHLKWRQHKIQANADNFGMHWKKGKQKTNSSFEGVHKSWCLPQRNAYAQMANLEQIFAYLWHKTTTAQANGWPNPTKRRHCASAVGPLSMYKTNTIFFTKIEKKIEFWTATNNLCHSVSAGFDCGDLQIDMQTS